MQRLKTLIATIMSLCLLSQAGWTISPISASPGGAVVATSACNFSALSARLTGSRWIGAIGYAEPFGELTAKVGGMVSGGAPGVDEREIFQDLVNLLRPLDPPSDLARQIMIAPQRSGQLLRDWSDDVPNDVIDLIGKRVRPLYSDRLDRRAAMEPESIRNIRDAVQSNKGIHIRLVSGEFLEVTDVIRKEQGYFLEADGRLFIYENVRTQVYAGHAPGVKRRTSRFTNQARKSQTPSVSGRVFLPIPAPRPVKLPIREGQDDVRLIYQRLQYEAGRTGQPLMARKRPGRDRLAKWAKGENGSSMEKIEQALETEAGIFQVPAITLRTNQSVEVLETQLLARLSEMPRNERMEAMRQLRGKSRATVSAAMNVDPDQIKDIESGNMSGFRRAGDWKRYAQAAGFQDVYQLLSGVPAEEFYRRATGTGAELDVIRLAYEWTLEQVMAAVGICHDTLHIWLQKGLPPPLTIKQLRRVMERKNDRRPERSSG